MLTSWLHNGADRTDARYGTVRHGRSIPSATVPAYAIRMTIAGANCGLVVGIDRRWNREKERGCVCDCQQTPATGSLQIKGNFLGYAARQGDHAALGRSGWANACLRLYPIAISLPSQKKFQRQYVVAFSTHKARMYISERDRKGVGRACWAQRLAGPSLLTDTVKAH